MANSERLVEARKMRGLVVEAIEALTKRGAKSWNIGSQSYTSIDIADLTKQLQYWDKVIASLTGGGRVMRRITIAND
jgi:hypothetical protein